VVAGTAGLAVTLPIGITITVLLTIVAMSYFQTIHAYPSGGGSYAVSRENLGEYPGLATAAALLVGYLLTAAVSLTAAVAALASAFPALWPYRVVIALGLLLIITLANLRGMQEAGILMSIPVYLFLSTYLSMLAYAVVRLITGDLQPAPLVPLPVTKPLTTPLILYAFASGCTALTGIEAISNGVPVFRVPESRNAGRTLLVMALLMGILFAGSISLTQQLNVTSGSEETILSALSRRILGDGFFYVLVQVSTMMILTVGANTSFGGFPRLTAILAEQRYMPRQLRSLGDRLVFTNGILLLSVATALLIVLFHGDSHSLVPLFATGVFLAFTLSQIGMVRHWLKERGPHWLLKAILNAVGAAGTGVTLMIVAISKFVGGAWITALLIAILVYVFLAIRAHYRTLGQQLSLTEGPPPPEPTSKPRVVIPIAGIHRGIVDAIAYARSISDDVTAVYVEIEPGAGAQLQAKWEAWWPDIQLAVIPSPYRTIVHPLLDYLDDTDRAHSDGQLATVVLPEFVTEKWWQNLLHNQTARLIESALLHRRRKLGYQRAIIDIPHHLRDTEETD